MEGVSRANHTASLRKSSLGQICAKRGSPGWHPRGNHAQVLEMKFPHANRQWDWQFVFPSSKHVKDVYAKTKCSWCTS
jgi:hypothetical protein